MKIFSQIRRQGDRSQICNFIRAQIRAAAVLLLMTGVCLFAANQTAAAAPGCPECQYRRSITIDSDNLGASCGGNISNFPVLVVIEGASYLKQSDNDGNVANANGYDIAFTDNGGNPLNHEIEDYDPATGALVAWVNVTVLSSGADTVIYMYYGDSSITTPLARPTDVWDGNYKGVWHMNQSPTGAVGDLRDSTILANHGQTVQLSGGDRTTGRIGDALDFDGFGDHVRINDPLNGADSETISAWVRHDVLPNSIERYITVGDSGTIRHSSNGQLHFYAKNQNNVRIHLRVDGALSAGNWYYVVGTWDFPGSTMSLYLNGVRVASQSNSGKKLKDSGTSYITSGGETIDGIIDEVRVSGIARDACWIGTEYNNQRNPSAFYSLGDEEDVGEPEVTTYTITATAGANGSISPAGAVEVEEGTSAIFLLVADENYEVDQVSINGGAFQDHASAQFEFEPVYADGSIQVTFKQSIFGAPGEDDTLPPGCSQNVAVDYSGGFDPQDLDIVNAEVNDEHHILLNTGNQAIDPNNIVIPFRQQVAVTFLYEYGNNDETDFGWMLASEGPTFDPAPHRIVYEDINDNDNNGAMDVSGVNTANRFGDRNGDGVVNALDNREVLGTFDAGTELVFFLKIDEGAGYRNNMNNPVTGLKVTDFAKQNEQPYNYTKTAWNQSRFTSRETMSNPQWSCDRAWGNPFEKVYSLGTAQTFPGACQQNDGWLDARGLARAADPFGLIMDETDVSSIWLDWDERWPAVMVGAPANDPNAWILGFEDLVGGGDADHNDVVFIIERETGGTVGLNPGQAIVPGNPDANINGVNFGVWDYMPKNECEGKTEIDYWLSIDAGSNWVAVDGWDEVYKFKLEDGEKQLKNRVRNWEPGAPQYTYRTQRVDFTSLGLSGRQLIWRADLKSRQEGCEPRIIDLELDFTASTAGLIGRSTPTVLANVMYSGSMETPALDWTSATLRGHLKATRIYDPADPSQTASMELWDAGDVLTDQTLPRDRKIYIPDVTVHIVDADNAERLGVGDGVTTFFSGRLAHYPVLATTVNLTDSREVFTDWRTDVLDGNLGGSGWINRATGQYRMEFATAPKADQPITATYSYFTYNTDGALRAFVEDNVAAAELGLDDAAAIPSGYIYDLNQDDTFNSEDTNWLINWTRGYQDGNGKLNKKEWVLGAIDHSVPAVATPPVTAPWYYGTAFPEDIPGSGNDNDRKGYREFQEAHADRRTVIYVGARDGMLHAFDGGSFRMGDNPCTDVTENRGYYKWIDSGDPDACQDPCSLDCEPDYGTGEELWAFIPANLLPRLKHNLMQGDDQSYVDASPALADVYTDGAWRTVLLAAEGNGGDTVFCLDVTDPDAPKFMWEFADPLLFRSRSSPAVAQIGRIYYGGSPFWVAFFVSGKIYDDTQYPVIFAVDIASGRLLGRIELDAGKRGAGGVLSGQPAIVDSDGNGYIDRLYIGSDKGFMYKINIPDTPGDIHYGLGHCVVNQDFSDRDGNQVPKGWRRQPIYASPTVVASNSVDESGVLAYDIRIFFGTGDSPYYDEDINFADTRYLFYAYHDTSPKGSCDNSQVELDWFFELPEGHRIYASAFSAAGNIYFGTSTGETEDPCDINANSDNNFDPNAGKLYAFDMHNPADGPLLERTVGNVLAAPVVADRHIYVQSASGDVDSFGSGQYNSAIRQGGIPQVDISWWREMY